MKSQPKILNAAVIAPVLIVWKTGGIKTILILGIAVSGNGTI